MTITISPPIPPSEPSIITKVTNDFAWLKHHIILLVITGVLVFGGVYGVENLIAKHDVAQANQYAQILAAQTVQTKALETQLSTDEGHWAEIEKNLLAENATLAQTIAKQQVRVVQQQKVDQTLDAQQTASRIAEQTKAAPNEVIAQGNTVVLDLPIARNVTSDLDLLDSTQVQLSETQKELANETTIAYNDKTNLTADSTLIQSLQTQNKDEITSCKAQVAVATAKGRKSFLKGFAVGFVTGALFKRLVIGSW